MQTIYDILKQIKFLLILLILFFCSYFIYNTSFIYDNTRYFTLFDDAMIGMRYANNMVNGHGLVYNPNEYVEGFTHFLWLFLYAAIEFIGIDNSKTSLFIALICLLILFANIFVSYKTALKSVKPFMNIDENNKLIIQISIILLAGLYYAIIFWSLFGLEVGIIALLLNCAIYKIIYPFKKDLHQSIFITITVSVLFLIRMDTIIYSWLILLFYFTAYFKKNNWIKLIFPFATLLLVICALTTFRVFYYNDYLPNTFYLKVSVPIEARLLYGFKAVLSTLFESSGLYLYVYFFLLLLNLNKIKQTHFSFIILLISFMYTIYIGGDSWEENSFPNRHITVGIATTIPSVISLLLISLHQSGKYKMIVFSFISALIVCILYLLFFYHSPSNKIYLGRFGNMGLMLIIFLVSSAIFLYILSTRFTSLRVHGILLTIVLLIWLQMNAYSYLNFYWYDCKDAVDSKSLALFGLDLKKYTKDGTKIAVTFAGVAPYFSELYTVDLMGKCDKKIAKMPARKEAPFKSGHMKWDLIYSLQKYKPDIILHTWVLSEEERLYLKENYDVRFGLLVKKGYEKYINPKLFENLKNNRYVLYHQ